MKDNNLQQCINETKLELDVAISNFNNVVEKDLIDYWSYQIKSIETKYGHLVREMKKLA